MSLIIGNFKPSEFNKKLKAIANGAVDPFAKDITKLCNEKYEYIGYLGKGGETFNFLIENTGIENRKEVLKIKRPELNKLTSQRFFRSIKIYTSYSSYRCFPTLYFADSELPFMTIEYIKGSCLFDYILSHFKDMPDSDKIKIWKEVAFAVSYLHESNIYHRDIKPRNIIVKDNGSISLIDYGLAKSPACQSLTMTGSPLGTQFYIPFEQYSDPSTVDHRADIFAMGRLLYFCLVGEDAETFAQEEHDGDEDNSFDPEKIENTHFAFIIDKATSMNPKDRYQTMEEFISDINEAMEQEEEDTLRYRMADTMTIKKENLINALEQRSDHIDVFGKLFIIFGGNLQKFMDYTGYSLAESRYLLNSARKRIFNEPEGNYKIESVTQNSY